MESDCGWLTVSITLSTTALSKKCTALVMFLNEVGSVWEITSVKDLPHLPTSLSIFFKDRMKPAAKLRMVL